MTSRGNQSVSPPAHLSQQRNVNLLSSGTPPPTQYYQGSSPGLSQGPYEYLPQAQNQAYLPYQTVPAYGSAINDIRGQPGNSGRAGPLQQTLSQGGNYYQQHGPNMRSQQMQQAPAASYYIGPQTPGAYCQPRPAQPSSQQMLYYPNFQSPSNVYTLPANMFTGPAPTVPMYQQSPFMQNPGYPAGVMCYQNGAQWRSPGMAPTGGSYARPPVREKTILCITDPNTGRNITEEILSNRPHPIDSDDPYEQAAPVSQNNIEIRQTFTRLVADRLKSPDEPSLSGPLSESPGALGGGAASASQYQQLPPQHQMQQQQPATKGPAPLMRTPMNGPPPAMAHQMMPARPGSNQQPPTSVTPPQEIQHQMIGVNLSIPPPHLPVRNQAVYNSASQQPQHAGHTVPQLSQTPPQQPPQHAGHTVPQLSQTPPQQPPQHAGHTVPQLSQTPPQQPPQHAGHTVPQLSQTPPQQPPQHAGHTVPQLSQTPPQQPPQHAGHPVPHLPQTPPHQQQQQPQPVRHMPPAMPAPQLQTQQPPHNLPSHQTLLNQVPSHASQNQSPPYGQISSSSMPANPAHQQIPSSSMGFHPAAQHNPSTILGVNPARPQIASSMPVNPAAQPFNLFDIEKPKQVEAFPQNNIPARIPGSPASSPVTKTAPPVKELSPAPVQIEQAGEVALPPPTQTVAAFREEQLLDKAEDSNKEGSSQGANAQGVKDVRKSKKSLKGLNRKEVSGSDMDAFIDYVDETNGEPGENGQLGAHHLQEADTAPETSSQLYQSQNDTAVNGSQGLYLPLKQASGEECETKQDTDTSKASDITLKDSIPTQKDSTPAQKESIPTQKDSTPMQKDSTPAQKDSTPAQKESTPTQKDSTPTPESSGAAILDNGYSKDKDTAHTLKHQDSSHAPKHQDSQKSSAATTQVESKYKQKKKKKKGHHSPPNQKSKQSSPSETTEKQISAVEADSKSSLTSSVTDDGNKDSKEEAASPQDSAVALEDAPTAVPDAKASPAGLTAPQEPATVTDLDQPPPRQLPETSSSVQQQEELVKDYIRTSSPEESNIVKEATPTADSVINVNELDASINQKQTRELPSSSIQSDSEYLDKPVDAGVKGESSTESVQTNESISQSSSINHRISDENESQESVVRQDTISKKGAVSDVEGETVSLRPQSERTVGRVRKDGRLQYDSAYLMELRDCPSSQAKPKGLPDLPEIILESPLVSASRRSNTVDFTPAFFQPSGNMRNTPPIGTTNSRNRQRPDLMMPQRVIKSVSLQDSVKPLHQSEKPWKPTPKQLSAGEIAEKKKTLESEVLFIMNRLTPTNFERLAEEMKKLDIHTYEDLQQLVRIFFDKVTIETKFVEAYAQLCKVMSSLKVPPPPNSDIRPNQATFRVVMLTKCQQEFEADKTSIFEDPEEKRRKMEAELPEGPERDAKIDKTLYDMKMRRLKFYGNIRFIGELFKLNMLTESIMHDCIYRLLKARDDDSLLSLCNLISTVGRELDTDKARAKMDQYFSQMAKISDERKSRIKFTLKDVIDLRNNKWVPRKEQTGPKKLQEVQKDFQQEQATKQFLQSQPLPPRSEPAQPSNRRGSKPRQDEKQVSDDGWNTVGVKVQRIDASKMRLSKNVVDENNIQLGPGGGMKQFSMWTRGSFGGAQPAQDNERVPGNRYSALRGEEDHRSFQSSPSRGDSGATPSRTRHGPAAGHGRGRVFPRSSQEGDRRDGGGRHGGRSQNSSRDNSLTREDRRQPLVTRGSRESENPMTRSTGSLRPSDTFMPPTVVSASLPAAGGYTDGQAVKKTKPLSEEEMEHKAKTILEEYLSAMDLEEAKLCVQELEGQQHISLLVTTSINEVLEKTHRERDLAGSFLHEIVKHGLLPLEVYLKGLSEVLSFAEDMMIDIPKIWTYLAQIIVPVLVGGSLSWPTLSSALKANLDRRCGAKLLAEILLVARDKTSERDVADAWQASNMNWAAFLDAENVEPFLRDKKLLFTLDHGTSAPGQTNMQKLVQEVESIIRRHGSNDEIFACIDKHAGSDTQDKQFIRSIVAAVVNASLSPTMKKLNEDVLKSRKDVLQHYIQNKPDRELQALYAIQALMHKLEHPSGVITSIFAILYDEEIISEETFKQWEKSADPQELEGKGACSMQLTQFFTWLRENEDPEPS